MEVVNKVKLSSIKKFVISFLVMFVLITSFSLPLSALKTESKVSNVLVIYSHHYNFEWVEELQKGIDDALEGENLYFYNEYLNENQLSAVTSYEDLFNSMYAKYKNIKFDCIIVADNYAYNFMAEYYETLTPNTPLVFVGVNGYSEDIAFTDMMTGIPQNSDMNGLIQLILSINSKDELIFISSQNATSFAEIGNIQEIIEGNFSNLNYRIIMSNTLDELLSELYGVENAQLIMIGNIITADGITLDPQDLLSKIFETTHLPIYTANRLQINDKYSGAVGGLVVNPYQHAYKAGLMVKQILNGVDVHNIPVEIEPLVSCVFNYNMLEYFNIDERILPPESVILGKKDTSIIISQETAIGAGIITFLIIIIFLILIIQSKKLKLEIRKSMQHQKELNESNNKFKAYIGMSPVGIFVTDSHGRYIEVNPSACQMTGYTEEELLNISISDFLTQEESNIGLEVFSEIKDKGFAKGEFRVRKKDGQEKWLGLIGTKINDNCIIAFCTDISERKERELRIEYLSFNDSVTRINNRAFFEDELKRLDNDQYLPLSYIISDTNGLKLINDTMGHEVGDMILIETAKVLKRNIRKNDILARIGGDEFAILMPKTSNNEAQIFVEHLRSVFQKTSVDINHQKLPLSISFGCATKTTTAELFSHITKTAEGFMYTQKLLERNSYHSSILNSLKTTLFERSHETEEHAERLVTSTRMLGKAMGLPESQLNELHLLSMMHDIGKISIDNSILTKPGKLTPDEWLEMKRHPGIGFRIAMTSPDLKTIAEYILCHHERWDGKGYPQGLQKENIPLLSRILAVADAYDAMTSDRVYRKALSKESAIAELVKNAGTQFDPTIVKLFLEIISVSDS